MPSASSLFLLFLYFRKSLLEIFSELDENLRGIFMRRNTPPCRRATWGPLRGQGRPPAVAPLGGAGGTRPCHLGTSSAPSDAYKIPLNLKTSGASIIFHRRHPDAPSSQTLVRGQSEADPGTLPEGRSIPEGSSSPCLPPG